MGRYAVAAVIVTAALLCGVLAAESLGAHPIVGTLLAAALVRLAWVGRTRLLGAWGARRLLRTSGLRGAERKRLKGVLDLLEHGHPDVGQSALLRLVDTVPPSATLELVRAWAALRLVSHRRFESGNAGAWAGVTVRSSRPAPHLERALLSPAVLTDAASVTAEAATVGDDDLVRILRARDLLLPALHDAVARPWLPLHLNAEDDLAVMLGHRFLFFPGRRLRTVSRVLQPRRRLPAREEAALLLLAFGREDAAAALLAARDAAGSLTRRGRAIRTAAMMLQFTRDDRAVMVGPEQFARNTRTLFFLHTRALAMTEGSAHLEALHRGPERLLDLLREKRALVETLAVLWARRPALAPTLGPLVRRVATGDGESRVPPSARRFLQWWRAGGRGTDDACVNNLRGLALLREGRPSEAEAEFERALELDPWFAAAAFNLAVALERSGRPGDPSERLRRVAEAAGSDPAGWLLLVEYMERADRVDAAEEVLHRILAADPMHTRACLTLGRLLLGSGRLSEAEEALRRALAADGSHPDALVNLALVYLESERPREALPLLATAMEATDGDRREEARYLLHVAFRDAEDHERALEILDAVPDRFLRRNEQLMEEAAGYLEERNRFDRSQRLWERLREMRARRGEL